MKSTKLNQNMYLFKKFPLSESLARKFSMRNEEIK